VELNLVPSESLTRARTFNVIKFAVVAWILLALFAFGVYSTKLKDKRAVEAEVAHWEGEIRRIEPRYNEAVAMKADAEGVMPRLRSLYELVASQYPWSMVLVELRTVIPDTVWLSEFTFDSNGNEVEIEGTCWYPTDLMRFLVMCHQSEMFVDVDLSSQQESQQARDMSGGGNRGVLGGGGGPGSSLGGPQMSMTGGGLPRGGSMGESLESYFRPDYRERNIPHLIDFTIKMQLMADYNRLGLGGYDEVFGTGGGGARRGGSAGSAPGAPQGIGASIGGPQG
jgi:Tfp pilus assembly protein PilN